LSSIRSDFLHIIFFLILTTTVLDLHGQRQRKIEKNIFSAGILVGLNATQMDGDFFVGFDKTGFTGGIKSYTYLTRSSSLVVEILYTQKGCNIPHGTVVFSDSKNDRKIDLSYIEIPFVI